MEPEVVSSMPFGGIIAIVVVVALIAIGFIFTKLYKRATKETAFVRTGLGGEVVVKDGGALVLPGFHEVLHVNMQTLKLDVRRGCEDALITRDRMRVDVVAEFYIRVSPTSAGISTASQTLGQRTMNPSALKELIEGKLVDVLRSVAAGMTLPELHEKRADFVQSVTTEVKADLTKNGLELESVSLTGLDQTDPRYFSEDNMFDAEGLTRLKQITESKRKERNQVEQDTAVEIAEKNREARARQLDIAEQDAAASLAQQKKIKEATAKQASEVAEFEAEQTKKSELARIRAEQETEAQEVDKQQYLRKQRIAAEREAESAEIAKQRDLEIAEQEKRITLAQKSEEQSAADAKANEARKLAIAAEQAVITEAETAEANRRKAIDIIQAEREAEVEATSIRVQAAASKDAAEDEAAAVLVRARAAADAERLAAEAKEVTMAVEADGLTRLNQAKNILSIEQVELVRRQILVEALPGIVAASTQHLTKIDSIRLMDAGGFGNMGGSSTGEEATSGSLADQLVSATLRHKAQAPLIDSLMKEMGVGDVSNLSSILEV